MNFWVIGGDERQAYLAGHLARDGHAVSILALDGGAHLAPGAQVRRDADGIERADCVILPMPVCTADGLLFAPLCDRAPTPDEILSRCTPAQTVCGGRVTPAAAEAAGRYGLTLTDYFAREELAIRNAVPTAEGALALAMEALSVTVQNARVLILGFGRVGQACALRFGALGARVRVVARRGEQLALAHSLGFPTQQMGTLADAMPPCELVVNTVPAAVLGEAELSALAPGTPVIELASAPGGVDTQAAKRLGVRVIPAPGLPGRVAPATAAAYLRDTIYTLLQP